jgi:uncharacterized protein (UPF0276 family)
MGILSEIACRADCLILLDVSNIYVSATTTAFDAEQYLNGVPASAQQIHRRTQQLRRLHHRYPRRGCHRFGRTLYAKAIERVGPVSTMIERDDAIPPLADLVTELEQARRIAATALRAEAA